MCVKRLVALSHHFVKRLLKCLLSGGGSLTGTSSVIGAFPEGSISCSGGGRVVFLLSLESPLIHHCFLLCSLFVLPRCSRCSLAVWHPAWPARTPGIRSRLICSDFVRWAQQTQSAREDKQGSGLPPSTAEVEN